MTKNEVALGNFGIRHKAGTHMVVVGYHRESQETP